ncbi:MAG: flagellar basal body P-ring formation chaperone FlgA [Desulfobulbus sp.]|nr:flagellar basal body P-ring formation chaperone FlgA [Desulfobulbus sp.]
MIYNFFIACILVLLPCEALAQIAVQFQPRANVNGPRIVLGDIAKIRSGGDQTEIIAQLPIASSPAPGKSKDLYTVSVINALRNRKEVAGVDWQGSPTIVVERRATKIQKSQIETILAQFLKENGSNLPQAEIRLSILHAPEELLFPVGTLAWKVTPSRLGILGSTSFSIAFTVNGHPAGNCVIRVRLVALGEVAVAATPLRKGEILSARSIRLEKRDLSGVDDPYTKKEQLIGLEASRTITAGIVFNHDNISAPAIIKNGEMVTIIARKGLMELTTKGLAKENGRQGETIRVKNISSNKMIHCRVDRPGVVSVEF